MSADLKELYRAVKEFPAYREEQWEKEQAKETPAARIKRLRLEKAAAVAKYDTAILEAKMEASEAGQPVSASEVKAAFEARMKAIKGSRKASFHRAVRARFNEGATIETAMQESGCRNVNLMYALRSAGSLEDNESQNAIPDVEWEYHDHVGVHRYAMSMDRQWVKVHPKEVDGTPMYLTYPDMDYWAGGNNQFQKSRVGTLVELLDGVYAGAIKEQPNPYRRNK